jgi:hypothetical protein
MNAVDMAKMFRDPSVKSYIYDWGDTESISKFITPP